MTKRAEGAVRIWDLPTRLFHWLLVAAVTFELATGLLAPKWWMGRHIWVGYGIVILLAFRLVWAFFGSGFSRLRSFLYSPRQAIAHLQAMWQRRPSHYPGHNPAGAMMIFALLLSLAVLAATGMFVQGGYLKQGPFSGLTSFAAGSTLRSIHQLFAYLVLALVGGHLGGVLVGSLVFRERLIGAMIDGRKPLSPGENAPRVETARPAAAMAWLGAILAGGGAILAAAWSLPALGVPDMPASAAMLDECGACHHSFHPSLLPRASWAAMMAGLAHHFGEDASLPDPRRDEIAAYLEKYAAEAWDTLPARRFSVVSPDDPLRITATPAWQRLHRRLSQADFARKPVGSRINCVACHRDADSGAFAPQSIAIPGG